MKILIVLLLSLLSSQCPTLGPADFKVTPKYPCWPVLISSFSCFFFSHNPAHFPKASKDLGRPTGMQTNCHTLALC